MEKIARIEKISKEGTKEDLRKRLAKKVRLKNIRKYYSAFVMKGKASILNHELVPPHRIMSKKEVKQLRKKYGLKSPKQLPKILVRDPVMIALGAKRGDVIEITRKSSIAGETKYYRVVI